MLSIIIITRNTRDLVENLLRSIDKDEDLKRSGVEVIAIDNGSSDGTAEMIEQRFPGVICERQAGNSGFARAANRGYGISKGEHILFLNSDTLLVPGDLSRLLTFLRTQPAAGICGPMLVYPDMRPQRSFALAPSLFREVVPSWLLGVLMPGRYAVKRKILLPRKVPSLIGAAMVVKREVMEALQGFDERFFFFLEETDLCVRARDKGYEVILFPDAKVVHLQGKTVGATWLNGRLEYTISLNKFIKKHHGSCYAFTYGLIRFVKHCLSAAALSSVAFLATGEGAKRRRLYHLEACRWYLQGCPENAGLRAMTQE